MEQDMATKTTEIVQKRYFEENRNLVNACTSFMKKSSKDFKFNYLTPKKRESKIEVGCRFCRKMLIEYPTNVNRHLQSCKAKIAKISAKPLPKKTFKCKTCGKIFNNSHNLNQHQKGSKCRPPFEETCKKCNKTFTSQKNFEYHRCNSPPPTKVTVAPKSILKPTNNQFQFEKSHKCPFCFKLFSHLENFQKHHSLCLSRPKHTCPTCKINFPLQATFDQHIKTCKSAIKCIPCDITFTTIQQKTDHVTKFHRLICRNCKNAYSTHGALKIHETQCFNNE